MPTCVYLTQQPLQKVSCGERYHQSYFPCASPPAAHSSHSSIISLRFFGFAVFRHENWASLLRTWCGGDLLNKCQHFFFFFGGGQPYFTSLVDWVKKHQQQPTNMISCVNLGSLVSKPAPLQLHVPHRPSSIRAMADLTVDQTFTCRLTNSVSPRLIFCSCVRFSLMAFSTVFSIHKFFRQLSVFSLCSPGLSLPYRSFQLRLFLKVSFSPDIIRSG